MHVLKDEPTYSSLQDGETNTVLRFNVAAKMPVNQIINGYRSSFNSLAC